MSLFTTIITKLRIWEITKHVAKLMRIAKGTLQNVATTIDERNPGNLIQLSNLSQNEQ